MARIVKVEEYTSRRNEILDLAEKLIYSKGYELMTIQDILDGLQMSKGAYYHYFASKQALLEGLIARWIEVGFQLLLPIVQDARLSALEKFQRYFDIAARWKTDQKAYLLKLMQGWYSDENAIVRQKVYKATIQRVAPLFTLIIHEGIQAGIFKIACPDQVSEVIFALMMSMAESLYGLILGLGSGRGDAQQFESTLAAYSEALERVLGTPPGSLKFMDRELIMEWVQVPVGAAQP